MGWMLHTEGVGDALLLGPKGSLQLLQGGSLEEPLATWLVEGTEALTPTAAFAGKASAGWALRFVFHH